MEVLAKPRDFILSAIIELVINKYIEKAQEHWLGSRPKLSSALQKIQIKLSLIQGRIIDAEKRANIDYDPIVNTWMKNLHDIIRDADKMLDEIEYYKLKKKFKQENKSGSYKLMYNFFSTFEYNMIAKLDEIEKKLIGLFQMADSYHLMVVEDHLNLGTYTNTPKWKTASFFDNKVFGRDDIIDQLIERLTQDNPTNNEDHILSITGMGGIGKTTVAQMIYNHEKVKAYFDVTIWVWVSDDFDGEKIICEILEYISYSLGEKEEIERSYVTLDARVEKLIDKLKGKRYFLVLDDVWNENPIKWEKFAKCLTIDDGNRGSKVLVTTRNKRVASIVSSLYPIYLDKLSDDMIWHILKTFVFDSIEEITLELEEILKKIARKLKGSPLAAKTVGHILRSNPNKKYWENILNSEIWALRQNEDDIILALMSSYQNLPKYLKPCFGFCSLLPRDYVYEKKEIVRMWIALGYIQEQSGTVLVEEIGEEYVKELLDRSMFQTCTEDDVQHKYKGDPNAWFKIHDLVHDVAKMVSANDSLMIHDERTMKQLSSSIQNLSIYIDDQEWSWKGHDRFDDFNNVRALIFLSNNRGAHLGGGFYHFLQKALPNMKFLKVLDLSQFVVENCPLPKLKHLRYLRLDVCGVGNLPSSLEYLYQLQVLDCERIFGIRNPLGIPFMRPRPAPKIRFLKNLRHISGLCFDTNTDSFLEDFHFLQELDLSVSKQSELSSAKKEENAHHKLKVLRAMKWMRELSIRGLENVASKEEAMEAKLKSMDRLTKLRLEWNLGIPSGDNVEEILEALHPGPNISVLEINGYDGVECPGWMESLSLLRELRLDCCSNMKFIRTRGLMTIKRLEIDRCRELHVEDGFEGFGALNTLEKLFIEDCPQLIADLFTESRGGLPSSLKEMEIKIWGSDPIINVSSTIMQSLTNLTALDIWKESVDSICFMAPSPINPPESQQLQQLSRLILNGLSEEEVKGWLLHLQGCTALVDIFLCGCSALFDTDMEGALVSFVSLRKLSLYWCNDCHSLPSRLCELLSLKELFINGCLNISFLSERDLPAGLQNMHILCCPLLTESVEKMRQELGDRGVQVVLA